MESELLLKFVLEAVGVMGLFGWLVLEGSGFWSLVRFFFRKPREGIKTRDLRGPSDEIWEDRG